MIYHFLMFLILHIALVLTSSQEDLNYEDTASWGGECQTGQSQSPINIETKNLIFCPKIKNNFKYLCMSNSFQSSTIDFKINSQNTGYVAINDSVGQGPNIRLYSSLQYHFHSPSQHTLNGAQYPLQMHNFFIAMSTEDGANITLTQTFAPFNTSNYTNTSINAAVISYFFYPSDSPKAIDFTLHVDENGIPQLNRLQILGCTTSNFWFHYRGSLTTPPCTENVDWFIYREPIPLKSLNYFTLKSQINHGNYNNRPIQNRNNRTIYLIGNICPF